MQDMQAYRDQVKEMAQKAERRIEEFHIRTFPGQPGPIFLISTTYPGVWLEHAFDAVCYAKLKANSESAKDVASNQLLLFLRNQKPDGRLPFNVMDASILEAKGYGDLNVVNYNQIQECVSVASLCLEVYHLTEDFSFLQEAYEKCAKWDEWLVNNRMTMNTGLIELFCLFDTGHDNSARLADVPVQCPDPDGKVPVDSPAIPILAPDMNAVFYGNRAALSEMARLLGDDAGAKLWAERAEDVRRKMMALLYDEKDAFFYDRDQRGRVRKFLSISITNVFSEHVLTREQFDEVYERHMKNPEEFWTPYPFPSMAVCDPGSQYVANGNSWGYFSQALTALRCMRWMDHYGKGADYELLLERWVAAMVAHPDRHFTQELDPLTGDPSGVSEWYSSAMLLFLYAARRLGYLDSTE